MSDSGADSISPSPRQRPSETCPEAESGRRGDLIVVRDPLDGSWVISGNLSQEVGESLRQALDAAEEAIEPGETQEGAAARRADALAMVARAALRRGLGAPRGPGPE